MAAGYSLAAGRMRDPFTEPSPAFEDRHMDDDRLYRGWRHKVCPLAHKSNRLVRAVRRDKSPISSD